MKKIKVNLIKVKILLSLILIFCTAGFPQTNISSQLICKITLESERYLRCNTPVFITLDSLLNPLQITSFRLEKIEGDKRILIPTQIESKNPVRLWWLLLKSINAGEKQDYKLKIGKSLPAPLVQIKMDDQSLKINYKNRNILCYQYELMKPPAGENPMYVRSGFIHPIWSPEGKILSRIHPSDHIHHIGFWNPWTKTEFEGRKVDFWNLKYGQGTVRFLKFNSIETGPVFGEFEALQQHVDLTAPEGEKVALNELWLVRVWAQNKNEQSYWIWDFTTTQSCASSSPLTILKYRYGGFGFRSTADWNEKNSNYVTSEGKTRIDGNGSRARWCYISGKTDNGQAGILFLSHPENHEFPEPMRIWPKGDVFFGFCPVVYSDWKMIPVNKYVRKYRVVVFDEKITENEAEQFWQDFVHPPKINVKQTSIGKNFK